MSLALNFYILKCSNTVLVGQLAEVHRVEGLYVEHIQGKKFSKQLQSHNNDKLSITIWYFLLTVTLKLYSHWRVFVERCRKETLTPY